MKARVLIAVAVGMTAMLTAGDASAAPKADPGFDITFSNCTNPMYNGAITVAGNGQWSPGFQGAAVFLPVSFGPFTGTATSPEGTFPIDEPPVTQNTHKGGNKPRVTCDYSVSGTDGDFSFEGTGDVTFVVVGKP